MKREASPAFRDLARRLLAIETGGEETPEGLAEGLQRALKKLHARMSRLITANGFEALLRRGLQISRVRYTFLREVEIQPEADDCLKGLMESVADLRPAEARDGLEAILANTFDVITIFIGKNMTLRQLHRVWPEISAGENSSGPREAGE